MSKSKSQYAIDRRAFLRTGASGIAGIGVGLEATTRAEAFQNSSVVRFDPKALLELRVQLGRTNVIVPGDFAYARTGIPQNGMYLSTRPGGIAMCSDENDVVACVKWCKKHGVSPVVRGGGHSYGGYSTTTGLLVDVSRINKVKSPTPGIAVVGGAASNRNVRDATQGSKHFLPGGTCLGVCVGGLVLGGGIGYNCRWAGLTSDSLVSTRIVTASGEVVEASASQNSDLFWACRGGAGGSFGINTSFTFQLRDVPRTNVTYFRFDLKGADNAFQMFTQFNKLMAEGDSRINAVARAQAVKNLPNDNSTTIMSRGQFIGSAKELRDLVASYPMLNNNWTMKEMPYWEAAREFVDEPQPPHSFGDISRYAKKPISDAAVGKQLDLLRRCPGLGDPADDASGSMWSLGWVGGDLMNKRDRTESAYVHRGMSTLLRPTCSWANGAEAVGAELLAWTQEMIAVIAPETPNESYQNFPNRLIKDWPEQYYAENLPRLIDIKAKYDSGNLFNNAQSIPANRT